MVRYWSRVRRVSSPTSRTSTSHASAADKISSRRGSSSPVAGGMAGGSTDAASVVFGINRLFQLGLSQKELMKRGETLGADVPYCILRGTALAEGLGEKLTPLPDLPKCIMVIAKPPVSVSTAKVYEKLDGTPIKEHPPIDGILEGLQAGSLETVVKNMGNVLESVTVK